MSYREEDEEGPNREDERFFDEFENFCDRFEFEGNPSQNELMKLFEKYKADNAKKNNCIQKKIKIFYY